METCETCKHLHKTVTEKQTQLFCRRYPPTSLLVPVRSFTNDNALGIQPVFPPVEATYYCGEFDKRTQYD